MLRCLVVLFFLLGAAPAGAGTFGVLTQEQCERSGCGTVQSARFLAGAGEANRLSTRVEGADTVVHDDGAAVVPGPGCRPLDAATVACPSGSALLVETGDGEDAVESGRAGFVRLGSGDDRFTGAGSAYGGTGADVLTTTGRVGVVLDGEAGDDVLTGGQSRDTLVGGPDDDVLLGLGGDDVLDVSDIDNPPTGIVTRRPATGDDRANGGPGRDQLTYGGRETGVSVDLRDGLPEGGLGERDFAVAIEDVHGGAGDDRLIGDAGPNRLEGVYGRDELVGLGGDDELSSGFAAGELATLRGGDGDDDLSALGGSWFLDAGAGDDRIETGDSSLVRCGSGRDAVMATRTAPRLDSCERLGFPGGRVQLLAAGARPALRLTCPRRRRSCRVTLTFTDADGPSGSVRRNVAPGYSVRIGRRLNRPASGAVRVRIVIAATRPDEQVRARVPIRADLRFPQPVR